MVAVWTQMMQICSLSSCTVKDDSYCILDKQIKYCESEKEKIWLKKFGPSLESLASCTDISNAHNMKLRRRGNMNNVQCTAHANTKNKTTICIPSLTASYGLGQSTEFFEGDCFALDKRVQGSLLMILKHDPVVLLFRVFHEC